MKDYSGVEDTLFIPLVGRIFSSRHFSEFFFDFKSLELEQYIKSDIIAENTNEYFSIATVSRFYEFDKLVKDFINKNGECNILCLGAGLETMYFRIDDERATFYEIDQKEVIRQRKFVLGEHENEILIASDLTDYTWIDQIDKSKPSLAIICGVFQYMHHEEVVGLIKAMQDKFNNLEIAFDATNKKGIVKAEEYVKKTGNEDAMMYFYVEDINEFIKETNTSLISNIPFYKNCTKILKHKLKLSTKITCYFADKLGYTKIIHLKVK